MNDIYTTCLEDDSIWYEIGKRTGITRESLKAMRLACAGHHTGEIAHLLGKSEKTIHAQKPHAYKKLGVHWVEAAIRKLMTMAVEIHMERNNQSKGNGT